MAKVLPFMPMTAGDLFGLPPLGESRRNCTWPLNLDQASYELHRAIDFGGDAERLVWLDRWAEAMLAAARVGVAEHERACMLEHEEPDDPDPVDVGDVEAELISIESVAGDLADLLDGKCTPELWIKAGEVLRDLREALNDAKKELAKL